MIDPFKVTEFGRSTEQLEEFLLFSIYVAGKTAVVQAPKVHKMLWASRKRGETPFEYLRESIKRDDLERFLRAHKMGKYRDTLRGLPDLVSRNWDLRTVTTQELEEICGIGSKTSRFFVLHSRPNQEYVVFDTHLSKYFNELGIVPFDDTPSPSVYRKYEPIALKYLKEVEGIKDFAAFDLEKWTLRTKTKPMEA